MAKGSEHFAWKLFPGQPKRCWQCGKEPLIVDDVGEHRTLYPFRKTEFLCRDCATENVQKAIRENVERMQR